MKLRPYQQRVSDQFRASTAKSTLVVMPTGAGKTVLFTNEMREFGGPSVAIAHRRELVTQMSLALGRYGIVHRVVAADTVIREVVAQHVDEFGRSFYDPGASSAACGVDALGRLSDSDPIFTRTEFAVIDEGHHALPDNKWGKAVARMKRARIMGVTACPRRADGKALRGVYGDMIVGPPMRSLIDAGNLSDYHVYQPALAVDMSRARVSKNGEFNEADSAEAHHAGSAKLVGDAVAQYEKHAPGEMGMAFSYDVTEGHKLAEAFRQAGHKAEFIDGSMGDTLRVGIMRRFRRGETRMLVSVDLMGEGVDVPAVKYLAFCRRTASLNTYMQQFGRGLRTYPGKGRLIVGDHVGNVAAHGLPDAYREWSLDGRDRATRDNTIMTRTCPNPSCGGFVYERIYPACPMCGLEHIPALRRTPEQVEGDLVLLDDDVREALLDRRDAVDNESPYTGHLSGPAAGALRKRHQERIDAQEALRTEIATWIAGQEVMGVSEREATMRFYQAFGTDLLTAQTLGAREATELMLTVIMDYAKIGVYDATR